MRVCLIVVEQCTDGDLPKFPADCTFSISLALVPVGEDAHYDLICGTAHGYFGCYLCVLIHPTVHPFFTLQVDDVSAALAGLRREKEGSRRAAAVDDAEHPLFDDLKGDFTNPLSVH